MSLYESSRRPCGYSPSGIAVDGARRAAGTTSQHSSLRAKHALHTDESLRAASSPATSPFRRWSGGPQDENVTPYPITPPSSFPAGVDEMQDPGTAGLPCRKRRASPDSLSEPKMYTWRSVSLAIRVPDEGMFPFDGRPDRREPQSVTRGLGRCRWFPRLLEETYIYSRKLPPRASSPSSPFASIQTSYIHICTRPLSRFNCLATGKT